MDNWQAWAAGLFSVVLTILVGDRTFEKKRGETRNQKVYDKLDSLKDDNTALKERLIRVEAEVVTEREVRELMTEFMTPFLVSLNKIDNKTDNIDKHITAIRISLAAKGGEDNVNTKV